MEDYIDYWTVSTHFETFKDSQLAIDTVQNDFLVQQGKNQVLIVTIEREPIFKEGKELTDLYSSSSLLFELNNEDSIVTPNNPLKSKLLRKLIAFSPEHGIKKLYKEEKIKLVRIDPNSWKIESKLQELDLSATLNFKANQDLIIRHKEY